MDISKLADEIFKAPTRTRTRASEDYVRDEDAQDEFTWALKVEGRTAGYFTGTRDEADAEAREVEAELGLLYGTVEISL